MRVRSSLVGCAIVTGVVLAGCGSSASPATVATPRFPHLTLGDAISFSQFDSLTLGEPQAQVMSQLGHPESRQRVVTYGFTHEEPKRDSCVYYRRRYPDSDRRRYPDSGDRWSAIDTFQLCFRGSRLRYKWAYIADRA
jgi:hypothetical protein